MEHFDSWESSYTSSRDDQKVEEEPIELLEENWFFNNLFRSKTTTMIRSASDPIPSCSGCQEMTIKSPPCDRSSPSSRPEVTEVDHSNQEASASISKVLPTSSKSMTQGTSVGRQQVQKEPEVDNPNKDLDQNPCNKQSSSSLTEELQDDGSVHYHRNLVRAPSLPRSIGRAEKVTDGVEECIHGSRKLMRQASLNPSSVLPLQHNPKRMILPSPSIRRHRTRRETKVDRTDINKESHHSSSRVISRTLSRRKTMSDLEIEELQGFKDLGFTFNKEALSPSVVNIIPGLRNRSEEANWDENKVRMPYLSEAWLLLPRSAPQMPNWVERRSVGDMKEQLKFWAQTVASNMRQEC